MRGQWDFNQDDFDRFLAWLDPDRERAGTRYEDIRRKLIKIFECRGCSLCEDLADETINRVIRKMRDLADTYIGDPALYFYGVARNVRLEHHTRRIRTPHIPPPVPAEEKEREYECLEQCMKTLTADNRDLMLEYYKSEKRIRIVHRKELAVRLGIAPNALRLRAFRIRAGLQTCVESCLQLSG